MAFFIDRGSSALYGSWETRMMVKNGGGRIYYLVWRVGLSVTREAFLEMLNLAKQLAVKYAIDPKTGKELNYTISPAEYDDKVAGSITIDVAASESED